MYNTLFNRLVGHYSVGCHRYKKIIITFLKRILFEAQRVITYIGVTRFFLNDL